MNKNSQWSKENRVKIVINLNKKKDADIIRWFNEVINNKNEYLKALIRGSNEFRWWLEWQEE